MLNVPGRSCPWSTDRQADLLRCGRSPYPYGSRRHAQRANQTWGRPTSGPPGQPLGGGTTHTTATSNVSAPGADAEQVALPAGQATSCTWPVPTSAKSNSLAFSPLLKFITSVVAGFATCTSLLNAVQSRPLTMVRLSVTSSPIVEVDRLAAVALGREVARVMAALHDPATQQGPGGAHGEYAHQPRASICVRSCPLSSSRFRKCVTRL